MTNSVPKGRPTIYAHIPWPSKVCDKWKQKSTEVCHSTNIHLDNTFLILGSAETELAIYVPNVLLYCLREKLAITMKKLTDKYFGLSFPEILGAAFYSFSIELYNGRNPQLTIWNILINQCTTCFKNNNGSHFQLLLDLFDKYSMHHWEQP